MKRNIRRALSFLLAVCMCVALLPQLRSRVNAVTPNYTVSSAYRASEFYSNLLGVELTGNQREDIINVALSQVGYREGNYSGDTGGENDGYYNNYTESNYWYHNYVSTDMPIGGSYAPWCATFVSWCAEMAGIPRSIIGRSTCASRHSYGFDVVFYAGGSTLYSSSDNDSRFMGYNYTPKKGDLFFTRSWSHVGLVVGVSGSYVITVEGNTNSDGSAEGDGVFRRTSRRIADLYFGVPDYEESYLGSCTYYPAHCKVTVNSGTSINSQPCSVSSANNSVKQGTATVGRTYTATGLYRNTYGEYWYRVETTYGDASYLNAGDTTYVSQITSDISLKNEDVPSPHIAGKSFTVSGTIASEYNRLDTATCNVYPGFDQGNEAATGYTDTVNSTQYVLNGSGIDLAIKFGSLQTGNYTYELTTTYTNYYINKNGSVSSNTGTIKLLNEYFVVIPSSVSQSTCNHSYTTTTLGASVCTEGGTQIKACSICGVVLKIAISAGGHSYGSWRTVSAATCTADGSQTRTCATCGKVETQTIAASGHKYSTVTQAATCNQYAVYEFTCTGCGHYLKRSANELASGWIECLPGGMDLSMFYTQTQYRYSDYETKTSTSSYLAGYTQISNQWIQTGGGSIKYVPNWPSGFSTSSSLYTQYNKAGSKVIPSETATARTVVESDAQSGYIYYHWCYAGSYYSASSGSGSYTTFHAYYDTTDPNSYTCDTSDMSYKTSSPNCSNSNWWFVTDVYQQDYTQYQNQYVHERWTPFSDWSSTPVTADENRRVETRTVYQLKNASLAAHNYVNGRCTVCGAADPGFVPQNADYYLFGLINGVNYGCEEDYSNLGNYKFVNGKLTTTFSTDSYVAVKNGNNVDWYMTDGWQGTNATSVTLCSATELVNADQLYVPGGKEVTFTLTVNSNNTMVLSYTVNGAAVTPPAPATTPTVTPKSPSLTFKDEVTIDVHFTATDLGDLTGADLGLLTWGVARPEGTVADAESNVLGASYNSATGRYLISTKGIPAKLLGDTVYMKLYVKLANGSYVYSKLFSYSPKTYAINQLKNSTDPKVKALMVAMLNYGAAAQTYFGYKPYSLANNGLTAEQKSLISSYSANMVPAANKADSSKTGIFANSAGFSSKRPAVSFGSAFSIEYFFTPAYTPSGSVTMYYWTQADYSGAATLSASNASGRITMTPNGDGSYHCAITGIAAKDLNQTIYVAGGYRSGTTNHCTGILPYSIGTYCASQVSKGADVKDLAAATAVYGYYANAYFNG